MHPVFPIVVRDIDAPVVTQDEVPGAFTIDPQSMVVAVYIVVIDAAEGFASIIGAQDRHPVNVNFIRVIRSYPYLTKVIAITAVHLIEVIFVGTFPRLAFIIRTVNLQADYIRFKQQGIGVFGKFDQTRGFGFIRFDHFGHFFHRQVRRKTIACQVFFDLIFFQSQKLLLAHGTQLRIGEHIGYFGRFGCAAVVIVDGSIQNCFTTRTNNSQTNPASSFSSRKTGSRGAQ